MHRVERLRELFDYDPETGVVTRKSTGRPIGTLFTTGHLQASVDGMMTGVHRIAFALLSGEYPAVEVDHINGDGADNRACNLRLATSSQNNQNRRLSSRNKSGVKGVFRVKANKKPWRVSVGLNGRYYITHFAMKAEAVAHVKQVRQRLHAQFANDGRRPMVGA